MPISQAQPTAPPARKPRTAQKPAIQPKASRQEARQEALDGIGKITSLILAMRGAYADAGAVAQHGPNISHEAAALAETDERIGSWIDYVTEAGPYMGLATAIGMLAMQVAANHGRVDAAKFPAESGILPPEVLEARVKADMETTRLRFLQQAQDAQNQAHQAAEQLAARTPNGKIAFTVEANQN